MKEYCPYIGQRTALSVSFGFLGGTHSGHWYCEAHNCDSITNEYHFQVCENNNAANCMHCSFHPVR